MGLTSLIGARDSCCPHEKLLKVLGLERAAGHPIGLRVASVLQGIRDHTVDRACLLHRGPLSSPVGDDD